MAFIFASALFMRQHMLHVRHQQQQLLSPPNTHILDRINIEEIIIPNSVKTRTRHIWSASKCAARHKPLARLATIEVRLSLCVSHVTGPQKRQARLRPEITIICVRLGSICWLSGRFKNAIRHQRILYSIYGIVYINPLSLQLAADDGK